MPFLQKIVSGAWVGGLIHNINTNTGKGQRKMFNDMKRINSDLRVFEIAVSDVTIRLPHVEGNEENTIPFRFRDGIQVSGESSFRAIRENIIENTFFIINENTKIGTTLFRHGGMNFINSKIDRKREAGGDKKAVGIELNQRNRNVELVSDILISCVEVM